MFVELRITRKIWMKSGTFPNSIKTTFTIEQAARTDMLQHSARRRGTTWSRDSN